MCVLECLHIFPNPIQKMYETKLKQYCEIFVKREPQKYFCIFLVFIKMTCILFLDFFAAFYRRKKLQASLMKMFNNNILFVQKSLLHFPPVNVNHGVNTKKRGYKQIWPVTKNRSCRHQS